MRAWPLAVLAVGGCLIGGGERTVTALELRAHVANVDLNRLDQRLVAAVEQGQIWPGATETELFLARGNPHMWWNTRLGQNACRVFVHHADDPSLANVAVTTCGGRVIQAKRIDPGLPCWRLAEVGPRVQKALEYFEQRPLDVQWQIVIGIMQRGQAEEDVMISFGEPANRGFDEREDGKRAEKLVFLDHSGDAYGLNVTLIDNKVVAWAMPAERTLTPEAQQRRLDAVEQRLTKKIAELEALTIRQHQETVKLFGDVMAKQDRMMSQLTTIQANQDASSMMQVTGGQSTGYSPSPTSTRSSGNTTGAGNITTSTTRSDPPRSDPFAARNACFKRCEAEMQAHTASCKSRWDHPEACRDEACRSAVEQAVGQCMTEHNYASCSAKCNAL